MKLFKLTIVSLFVAASALTAVADQPTTAPVYECNAEHHNCYDVKSVRKLVDILKDNSRPDRFEAEYGLLNDHLVAIEDFYTEEKRYIREHNFVFRSHFCALAYYFYDAEYNINREFEVDHLRGTLTSGKKAMFRIVQRYEWGLNPWSAESIDESGNLGGHEFQCEGAGISRALALGIERLAEQILDSSEVTSKEKTVLEAIKAEATKLVGLREGDINVNVDASARKIIELWDNNYDSVLTPFVKQLRRRDEVEVRARMVKLKKLMVGLSRHKNYSVR